MSEQTRNLAFIVSLALNLITGASLIYQIGKSAGTTYGGDSTGCRCNDGTPPAPSRQPLRRPGDLGSLGDLPK